MATAPPERETRTLQSLAWIAIVLVVVTDVGYVVLIRSQESNPADTFRVLFVAAYLGLMAAMLAISMLERPRIVRLRPTLRASAAAGLLVLGALAIFSIGIPIIAAGALATGAAIRSMAGLSLPGVMAEIAAAVAAVAVLVAGFEITERLIICPATGFSGGSGYGLVTGGYHWTCADGRLDFRSGFCSSSGGGIDANGHAFATNSC